jgi:peptide/nickel transport system substrate-binding protein
MPIVSRATPILLAVFLLVSACAPSQQPSSSAPSSGPGARVQPAAPKRVTAAIAAAPSILFYQLAHNSGAGATGIQPIDDMINGRLAAFDDRGQLLPLLAEAVPTTDNGQWRVFPDGRMETTWRMREGTRWHDGTPFTTADVLFHARVVQDREIAVFADVRYESIEEFEAIDDRTFTVKWRRPHIEANEVFTYGFMPRHILEPTYLENKAAFTDHRYWSDAYIGTGPYRMQEFVRDSHIVLQANDAYPLGRPRIDEVVVRFMPDNNTLLASILAGGVDMTLGQTLSIDQAMVLRDQWPDGKIVTAVKRWWEMHPQHYNPTPAIVANADFRRAMLQAIDRPTLAETIGGGSPVAHSIVSPDSADYRLVESGIVRYDYDPRQATQGLERLGYVKAADGFYRDASGQRLTVEVRTSPGDANEKSMLAIAANWQQLGVAAEPFLISAAQNRDQQFRSEFPGFNVRNHPTGLRFVGQFFHSSEARTPENRFLGSNGSRYRNPEMDAFIDAYFSTIPERPRFEHATRALQHATDQVVTLGLFYGTLPTMVGNRIQNVGPGGERAEQTWNLMSWDLK